MATWSNWKNQLLNAAGILPTPPIYDFLNSWAADAHSPNCGNNPIDLSVAVGGSTHCARNTGIHPWTQRYTTHAHAAEAFNQEIHQSWAKGLLDALNTGNPYQVSASQHSAVVSVLVSWGSVKFAHAYDAAGAGGGGGSGGGGSGPTAHDGWEQLRTGWEQRWPKNLRATDKAIQDALRSLSHGRKVHR